MPQAAFEDWFDTTITEPSDPHLLYAKQCEVMPYSQVNRHCLGLFLNLFGGHMRHFTSRSWHGVAEPSRQAGRPLTRLTWAA
jgi:hypothetical protein